MEDERFSRITSDAKYRRIPKKSQKVKIDNRFQSMFKDKKFKEEYTVDQRGRPVKHSTAGDLKRYYHLSSEESSSENEDEEKTEEARKDSKKDSNEKHVADKTLSKETTVKLKNLKVDYARGEQALFSESSSDDESEDEGVEDEEETIEHKWGELDAEAESTEEATCRLAACNMDWDRIRAVDILVLLNSFLPPSGKIESVKIFVSEFGKKRLAEEEVSGPPELREMPLEEDEEEKEEGSKYHMEKLRQYQLNRLKYYYAVITFSDVNTANHVYTECDGMEYESSSTKIDLRFIPDDMEFDDEPKEVCEKLPEMTKYQPKFFVTTALQQAKVDLTWDETNPERIELTQKINKGKLDEVDQNELQNYLALSDEESQSEEDGSVNDETNDNPVEKYKALLLSIEEKEKEEQNKDIQMEVTWGLEMEKKSEELVKKKLAEKEEKTPFQQYLDKRKEKRKEKKKNKKQLDNSDEDDIPSDIDMNDPYFAEEFKGSEFSKKKVKQKKPSASDNEEEIEKQAELELLLMNEDSEKKHFSLKKIQEQEDAKSKKKKKKNKKMEIQEKDDFEVDVSDARFSAVFSSHHYNIDPSDPHYKKTQGMEKLIGEKLKRRTEGNDESAKKFKIDDGKKKNAELSVLVKSIKRKTQAINKNK